MTNGGGTTTRISRWHPGEGPLSVRRDAAAIHALSGGKQSSMGRSGENRTGSPISNIPFRCGRPNLAKHASGPGRACIAEAPVLPLGRGSLSMSDERHDVPASHRRGDAVRRQSRHPSGLATAGLDPGNEAHGRASRPCRSVAWRRDGARVPGDARRAPGPSRGPALLVRPGRAGDGIRPSHGGLSHRRFDGHVGIHRMTIGGGQRVGLAAGAGRGQPRPWHRPHQAEQCLPAQTAPLRGPSFVTPLSIGTRNCSARAARHLSASSDQSPRLPGAAECSSSTRRRSRSSSNNGAVAESLALNSVAILRGAVPPGASATRSEARVRERVTPGRSGESRNRRKRCLGR